MQITINGAAREIASDITVAALITDLSLEDQRIAIEVNEEIVPRSRYRQHALAPGDRVEIVAAIGSG